MDDKSQKLNLAHAWLPVQTALNSKCDIILMLYVSYEKFHPLIWSSHQTVFIVERARTVFFNERDKIDREQYLKKSHSSHLNVLA